LTRAFEYHPIYADVIEIASNYIPRKQLAKELGERMRGKPYREETLIRWENEGRGPPTTRVGRDVVYRADSVEKWLRAQEKAKPEVRS
jgi:hypothetical protein